MKRYNNANKALCLVLALLLVAVPVMAEQAEKKILDDYTQGKADGERDAKGNTLWFFAGCCLGGTGIILAFLVKPDPPGSALLGKSPEYCMGYTEGYQAKASKQNVVYAVAGCITFWTLYLLFYVAVIIAANQ